MWYVEVTANNGKKTRYEGLTYEQAADIHKREWLCGGTVTSGKIKPAKR